MIKNVYAILVSTMISKFTFNIGDRVLDTFWSSLGMKMVEGLICSQNWLQVISVILDHRVLIEDVL